MQQVKINDVSVPWSQFTVSSYYTSNISYYNKQISLIAGTNKIDVIIENFYGSNYTYTFYVKTN
jgi:hypothetical protein